MFSCQCVRVRVCRFGTLTLRHNHHHHHQHCHCRRRSRQVWRAAVAQLCLHLLAWRSACSGVAWRGDCVRSSFAAAVARFKSCTPVTHFRASHIGLKSDRTSSAAHTRPPALYRRNSLYLAKVGRRCSAQGERKIRRCRRFWAGECGAVAPFAEAV